MYGTSGLPAFWAES